MSFPIKASARKAIPNTIRFGIASEKSEYPSVRLQFWMLKDKKTRNDIE